jgi:plastocyanin
LTNPIPASAPVRTGVRAGAVVWACRGRRRAPASRAPLAGGRDAQRLLARAALLVAALVSSACDRVVPGGDAGPRVLELAHDTIRLEAGVRLVDVAVRRQQSGDFEPAHVQARQGDVVRFTAEDRAGHAIVFVAPELAPDARQFLEESGQMRSPPFITDGSAWVITLAGAPPGEYPFHCTTHDVRGRLTVTAPN